MRERKRNAECRMTLAAAEPVQGGGGNDEWVDDVFIGVMREGRSSFAEATADEGLRRTRLRRDRVGVWGKAEGGRRKDEREEEEKRRSA